MNRPESRSKIGCLLALSLSMGLAGCDAQDSDAAFSEIALPTFSRDRVAREAPVEARRLLSGGPDWELDYMSPSPDGRFLTDVNWSSSGGGDVSVIDLATGEERSITHDVLSREGVDFPDASVFSPDGSRIAYAWYTQPEPSGWAHQVRSVGVDGTDMKVHLSGSQDVWHAVLDWSKDGRYLLVGQARKDEDSQIGTIDLRTDEFRMLETLVGAPVGSFFSPDGRFVAFDQRSDRDSRERDILIVSTDGGPKRTLLQTPDQEVLLGWLPDGSGILFHRIADDSRAIWKLPVQDGRPAGPPELVKDDVWQMTGFGFSDDAYLYGVSVSNKHVYTATFDFERGRMLGGLEPILEPSSPRTQGGGWSPDGRRLAYIQQDAYETRVVVRSVTGEVLQDLPLAMNAPQGAVAWTSHGLVISGHGRDSHAGIHLVSLETGEVSFVVEGEPGVTPVSADGSSIFVRALRNGEIAIIEHDLATGEQRILVEGEANDRPGIVSPDGDKVAHFFSESPENGGGWFVEILSLSTGERRQTEVFSSANRRSLVWSPDSRHVFFQGRPEAEGSRHLFQLSAEDGSLRPLMEAEYTIRNFSVSPDGLHVAMDSGEVRREIWRMTFNNGR